MKSMLMAKCDDIDDEWPSHILSKKCIKIWKSWTFTTLVLSDLAKFYAVESPRDVLDTLFEHPIHTVCFCLIWFSKFIHILRLQLVFEIATRFR